MRDFTKLSVNNNTLLRYRDLDYDMWYAISEYIDNSLHSYLANKKNLKLLGVNKCETSILIDKDENGNEYIIIEDNAGGINSNDFDRLLSIGVPKEKSEFQLSEFGMGMKTASIWLGNLIDIETKHYEENQAYRITIDITAIGTEEGEVKVLKVLDSSLIPGYTKIRISSLNRRVKNKTKKVGVSLASIYKKYIESGDINITFQDTSLTPQTYTLEQTSDGSEMKKSFKIILSNGKECNGWIGIMKSGEASATKAGFSIYRFNRLVMGYPENSWKPKEVFGEGASAKTNKLVGELDMTHFKIAHTKNKINFVDGEEEEFISQLKESCKDIANETIVRNAGKTNIKEHNDEPNTKISNSLLHKWASQEKNTNVQELVFIENVSLEDKESYLEDILADNSPITEFIFLESTNYEMNVKIFEFLDLEQPYLLVNEKEGSLNVFINVGHKFFQNVVQYDTSEQQLTYKLNCVFDAVSEASVMKRKGKIDPNEIRLAKNLFLKRYAEFYQE
jgi:hypothetical protein